MQRALMVAFLFPVDMCNKEPSVPCPATYGVMEVTRRFNRYFINNNNDKKKKKKKKKKINIIAIININIDNNNNNNNNNNNSHEIRISY